MSLREEIQQRRMAQSANGNATLAKSERQQSEGAAFLRLVKLSRQCWVLPWGSFHGVGFTPADAAGDDAPKYDRLHLIFLRHEVTVRGYNLAGVVTAIEATSLRELCETTEKYTDATTPVILAVEINVKTQ